MYVPQENQDLSLREMIINHLSHERLWEVFGGYSEGETYRPIDDILRRLYSYRPNKEYPYYPSDFDSPEKLKLLKDCELLSLFDAERMEAYK